MIQDTEREGPRRDGRCVSLRVAQGDSIIHRRTQALWGGIALGPHSIPFSWLQDPSFIQPFPISSGTQSPVTPALVTGTGKDVDLPLPSQTKAHVFSLVEKVKLSLLKL